MKRGPKTEDRTVLVTMSIPGKLIKRARREAKRLKLRGVSAYTTAALRAALERAA